jgi:hypothetical protein
MVYKLRWATCGGSQGGPGPGGDTNHCGGINQYGSTRSAQARAGMTTISCVHHMLLDRRGGLHFSRQPQGHEGRLVGGERECRARQGRDVQTEGQWNRHLRDPDEASVFLCPPLICGADRVRATVIRRWEVDPSGDDAYGHPFGTRLGRRSGSPHVEGVHHLVE